MLETIATVSNRYIRKERERERERKSAYVSWRRVISRFRRYIQSRDGKSVYSIVDDVFENAKKTIKS